MQRLVCIAKEFPLRSTRGQQNPVSFLPAVRNDETNDPTVTLP